MDFVPELSLASVHRFTGVSWSLNLGKWEAYVNLPPSLRKRCIGFFVDEMEAAQAVDEQRKKLVWQQA